MTDEDRFYKSVIPLPGATFEFVAQMRDQQQATAKELLAEQQHMVFCDPNTMCQHWTEDVEEFDKENQWSGV